MIEFRYSGGGESQIRLELNLLRAAHLHEHYDYYHLLSGVDLPLKSQDEIHTFFEENAGKEFIGIARSPSDFFDIEQKTRYYYCFVRFIRNENLLKKLPSLFLKVQHFLSIRRQYDVPLAKGSNWFSITNVLCEHLLERRNVILKRFKYTLCADEIFLQTEVINSHFKDSLYDYEDQFKACMREIDWMRGRPYIWKNDDIEELLHSDRLFARKFSAKYMEVIRSIKRQVNKFEDSSD